MAINWDSIEKQSKKFESSLKKFDSRAPKSLPKASSSAGSKPKPLKKFSVSEQARINAGLLREEAANRKISRQKPFTSTSFFADAPMEANDTFFDIDPASIYEAQEYRKQEQARLDREWQNETNKAKLFAGSIIQTADAAPGVLTETTGKAISNVKNTWDTPGYSAAVSSLDRAEKELQRVTLELTEEARSRFPDTPESALSFYVDKNDKRYQAALKAVSDAQSAVESLTVDEAVDSNSYAMKQYRKAKESGERFLEGMEGPARFLGEVGLSIGQNLATLPTAAINPSAPLVLMGSMSAADKAYQLNEQGVSAGEAIARGAVSGGIEAATEKIPLENVLALAKGGGLNSFVKNVLKQSGIEATEESVSYAANYLADKAFQDPNATFSVEELLYSALAGGVSGGIFGIGGSIIGYGANRLSTPDTSADASTDRTNLNTEQQKTAPVAEAVEGYQKAERHGKILDTVRANLGQVTPLAPVANLTGAEFQKTEGDSRNLRKKVIDFFNSIGNKVTRQDIGDIELNTSGARDSLAHGYGKLKAATFAALPQVLERGKIIAHNAPYEGHGYDSYIISAPVSVGSETVYVGALVIKDRTQRYKLHEVLTTSESGAPLFQSEAISQVADGPLRNDAPLGRSEYLPTGDSISSFNQEVNVSPIKKSVQIPVQDRTWQDAGNRKVNAFQYENPELHPFYVSAAQAMKADLSAAVKGERAPVKDADGYITGYTGTKRLVTDPIEQALDNAGLSYDQIDKALDAIIANHGQENYAAAKKVELVLDDMLANGYTDSNGYDIPPDEEYIFVRDNAGEASAMSEEEWASIFSQDVGPESSVGAAAKGFDKWSAFQGTKSEFFPEGANAARPVDVPTTDPQGRPIRKTASTAMGAKAIPDEVIGEIQNMVMAGELSYNKVSDRASIDRAVRNIQNDGFQRSLQKFSSSVQKGIVSKDLVTMGQQLLINAANAGDAKATAEILSLYAQMETVAGQAVQAASILRKLSPTAQLYAAQKVASNLEKTLSKQLKGKNIEIDTALIEEFEQQIDQDGRDAVMDKIYQNIADQVPATWKDKWNAWRYLAMLGNPRTHIRNIIGNVGFQPIRFTKDRVAGLIEAAASAATGGKFHRTKSFAYDPALYASAWNDYNNVAEALSGSKYDDVQSIINDRRTIFKAKPLEKARRANSNLLNMEDALFKRVTYADALSGYLAANGVTAEQMKSGGVPVDLLSAARDYAGQEALRSTFNDRNVVSDRVVHMAKALGTFGEAVLPFKRTPANILVRGFEYSPLGLIFKTTYDVAKVKSGEMSGAQLIDDVAKGMTGSALFALGAFLAASGVISGGAGDDEKQAEFDQLTGKQTYALNLPGGGSVTLDWLAPEALPFFMGAQYIQSAGESGFTTETVLSALTSISEPMLEMSMLQSLNDLIDNVSFAASNEKFQGLIGSALVSYLTQALPTIGGQIERSSEDMRMSTYTDKNNPWVPADVQYALGKASAKIPGWDYQQIPFIDAWGRQEPSAPQPLRTFNNFLNPAYTSQENMTPLDKEIQRIYDQTGDGAVMPSRAPRYLTVGGERIDLTADQYVQYATDRGEMSYDIGSDIIKNSTFKRLSDEQKADVLDDVYTYADAIAKSKVSDYEPDDWISEVEAAGIDPSISIMYHYSDAKSETKRRMLMDDDRLSAKEKLALDKALISDKSDVDYTNEETFTLSQMSDAAQRKYEKAESWGMGYADYAKYYPICTKQAKKEEVINALVSAGMSKNDAYKFYSIVKSK